MTQDRPNEYLIKSGNYFKDIVDNIVEIFTRAQKEDTEQELTYIQRIHDIWDHDILQVPDTPCIAVSWTGFTEEITTMGMGQTARVTHKIESYVSIFYYHQELDLKLRKDQIRDALWELTGIFRRNSDLNGLSSIGATVNNGQVINRIRNGKAYAGAQLDIKVPILIQSQRVTTAY